MLKTYEPAYGISYCARTGVWPAIQALEHIDLSFLNNHPKVVGFMQAPIDGGFVASSFAVPDGDILAFIDRYARVAPYYAWRQPYNGVVGIRLGVAR
jgi:hypothetical protein